MSLSKTVFYFSLQKDVMQYFLNPLSGTHFYTCCLYYNIWMRLDVEIFMNVFWHPRVIKSVAS